MRIKSYLLIILDLIAALLIPWLLLTRCAPATRSSLGLPAAPFASLPLLTVHLVAALPVALLAAAPCTGWIRGRRVVLPGLLGLALNAALCCAWLAIAPQVLSALEPLTPDLPSRSLLRAVIATLLLLPAVIPVAARLPRAYLTPACFMTAALAATLPPLAFARQVDRMESQRAAALLETGRVARALGSATSLLDLGSSRTIGRSPLAGLQRDLQFQLESLRSRLAHAPPLDELAPGARRDHAFLLVQLDQLDRAAACLEPIATQDPTAALLLASIARDRRQLERATSLYRAVIEQLHGSDALESRQAPATIRRAAWDGLIDALRADRRPEKAWDAVNTALRALPGDRAHFAALKGKVALDLGRADLALVCFERAIRLDPALAPGLQAEFKRIRTQTPACLPWTRNAIAGP